ncbi:MAG: hypothetical protein HY718_18240 [Planctomycetes bacterium]|nr:hypothetical protein [Planctomycetota bacterium]
MLIISRQNRDGVRNVLTRTMRTERLIDRVVLEGAKPSIVTRTWREFWEPCVRFAGSDTRLIHRLNRLKAIWRAILRPRASRGLAARYCWRYFGLLHHSIRIGIERGEADEFLPAVRRIVAFEAFTVEAPSLGARAGGIVCHRTPVFLLGRLPQAVCNPTPRHVPLALPLGTEAPFYHYRQYTIAGENAKILLFPSTDLGQRQQSFAAIDRFARLTWNRQDPFANSRARMLSKRVLVPLARAILTTESARPANGTWKMLDLGAGTGHLVGQVCLELRRALPTLRKRPLEVSCVDSSEPSSGRTHGLSGNAHGISSLEWSTADYRDMLDDESWIQRNGPFQITTLCRLLDNLSFFSLEATRSLGSEFPSLNPCLCLPHRCLSPRSFPSGIDRLRVGTAKRATPAGKVMPQLSLGEFFAAMNAVWLNDPRYLIERECSLPCRRFNPASLITRAGKSVIAQILKMATAIVIEDLDLTPEVLKQHLQQFGIDQVAAVHFTHDGFSTEGYHYVIAAPILAHRLKGTRL